MIGKVASDLAPDRSFNIIDPAPAVARQLVRVMHGHGLLNDPERDAAMALSEGAETAEPYMITDTQRHNLDLYSSGDLTGLERILSLIRR